MPKKIELVAMPGIELVKKRYSSNLQYHRNVKNITQKELSELSGVDIRKIQHYEQGFRDINKAEAMTVYKLAQALNCSVEDLLEFDDE